MSRKRDALKKRIEQQKKTDWIQVAVKEMAMEVEEGTKQLISVTGIDVSQEAGKVFEQLEKQGFTIEGLANPELHRSYMVLRFKGEFISSILVEFNSTLNIFRRILLTSEDEHKKAVEYTNGKTNTLEVDLT